MTRLVLRLYRAVVRLLPEDLRDGYAESMTDKAERILTERRQQGLKATVLAGWRLTADVVQRVLYEHWLQRRRRRGRATMDGLPQDVRLAVRGFTRQPAVTALLVGTLSLGVAAAIAVFALIDGVMLRPLPFREPDRLVYLNETAPRWNLRYTSINYPDFDQWRRAARTFDAMGLYEPRSVNLADRTGSDRVLAAGVTHDFFRTLGVQPVVGRTFTPEEDRPNGPKVVMIGRGLWRARFGAAPDVVGRSLRIDGEPYTVVGVLPKEAEFPDDFQLWLPLAADPARTGQSYSQDGIGRLKPGVTLDQARADLTAAHQPIWAATDSSHTVSPVLEPLRDHLSDDYRTIALALSVGVGLLLLSACANVASTMLARAVFRNREMSLRAALGARPGRIARQLVVESLVLALVAGLVGVGLGYWALGAFLSALPGEIPPWIRFDPSGRALFAAVALVGGTAALFGFAPVRTARRQEARAVLAGRGPALLGTPERRALHGFVVAEVVLATVLLTSAGLLLRAYRNLLATKPGIQVERVLTFWLSLPAATYPDSVSQRSFFLRLADRIAALPGVELAGWITCPPLGRCHQGNFFEAEGAAPRGPNDPLPVALTLFASPGSFRALGIRLIRGRLLSDADEPPAHAGSVVVSEEFVRVNWPAGTDPIGRRIRFRGGKSSFTVVGVVGDVEHYGLEQPVRPTVYLPAGLAATFGKLVYAVVMRTKGSPVAVTDQARAVVRELDPELPLFNVTTMEAALRRSMGLRQVLAAGLALFAAVALVLAVGGIYGVLSYVVGRRTAELGIRMAIGAGRSHVVGLVLRQGLGLVTLGLVLGVPAALAVGRLLASQLVGLSVLDPLIMGGVALVLILTGLIAALLPARRAATVDPKVALQSE